MLAPALGMSCEEGLRDSHELRPDSRGQEAGPGPPKQLGSFPPS